MAESKHSQAVAPATPIRQYFSRRAANRNPNLPVEPNFVGIYSAWAVFWGCVFLTVPVAYVYIILVLLREVCVRAQWISFLETYVPAAAHLVATMHKSSWAVEIWCAVEAVWWGLQKLHIQWLQTKDPLEASLSAAPLMELDDRLLIWQRMMDIAKDDPVQFVTGWFFDESLESISQYDFRDFVAWSMFEGRHQEHLTVWELEQLEDFVDEVEHRISLVKYGAVDEDADDDAKEEEQGEYTDGNATKLVATDSTETTMRPWQKQLPKPKQVFCFQEATDESQPNFFSNLYESYRRGVEQVTKTAPDFPDFKSMVKNVNPVKDLKHLMAGTAQHIADAEESAMATASHMYESLVPTGSQIDKQLSAMSQATYAQLSEAWNSVKNMKERLETARFLSKQRQQIRQQLKGYRVMLNRMREMSSAVPSKQMAGLMRRITECNEAMERIEGRAQSAFVQATGFAARNLSLFQRKEPQNYAKYSSDPLLGLATYPLGFHLLVLGLTEIPLRVMMMMRGFERCTVGPVAYYFHPGLHILNAEDEDRDYNPDAETPIAFVHGIGLGLIMYIPLIDALLETGRPIFLPEIPYVSGFRPWQSPNAVLQPAVVCGTMTAMLATHGYMRAAWMGHSYGTTWLSYLCKYAPHVVAAVLFLDPICFCLHVPRLTKSFVYMKPDPGTISYMVRTDVTINWTIQRSFPWAWVILFTEQIDFPASVFLSEKDALVPAKTIEDYLRTKDVPMQDFESVTEDHFRHPINCTVFRGDGHGDWTERPSESVPMIVKACEVLCARAEKKE